MSQTTIAFLGVGHPHVFARVRLLREMPDVAILGFFEPDPQIAERLADHTGVPRFETAEALLETGPRIAIINGLDPQVPGLAEQAAGAGVDGLLLEKPGAASPERFYQLAGELEGRAIQVEVGYELHYADSVALCRDLIAHDVLGDVTLARFHGGCPVGAGAELWQSIPEDPGGLVSATSSPDPLVPECSDSTCWAACRPAASAARRASSSALKTSSTIRFTDVRVSPIA